MINMKKNYWIDLGEGHPAHGKYFENYDVASELADDVGGLIRTGPDIATFVALSNKAHYYQRTYPSWRWGRCWFNAICAIAPDIAEIIRGDPKADPFHIDDNIDAAVKVYLRERQPAY